MDGLCILIPTFDKFRIVADLTRAKLDQHWPGHPPIFFCGLSGTSPDGTRLELRDDPADWMAVARSAAVDLQQRGFRHCYLILDDHPPMGRCHSRHLHETLPRLMDERTACYINLQGWGQHRPRQGEDLGAEYFHLERTGHEYPWKFALHPGLWNLRAFTVLLDALLRNPDPAERTCWKFERRAGHPDFELPAELRGSAYRVCGTAMAARPLRRLYACFRRAELFAFDVLRFLLRVLAGQKARDRFDAQYLGVYHFYDGPYPLFWSGLMKKGRLNNDLVFFLRLHARHALLAELRDRLAPPGDLVPDSAVA